jgi:hypothetical protein
MSGLETRIEAAASTNMHPAIRNEPSSSRLALHRKLKAAVDDVGRFNAGMRMPGYVCSGIDLDHR